MQNSARERFGFIAHALNGDGPFRPVVSFDSNGKPVSTGPTYLVPYPRESPEKFARRNELAWFASPLAQVAGRFAGYLTEKAPLREYGHALYKAIGDDADGRGNSADVFWQDFAVQAKARGTMLLLVDMPRNLPSSLGEQITQRAAPFFTAIAPELVTEYEIGDDGKFEWVEFSGKFERIAAGKRERVDCTWHFDRAGWRAIDRDKKILAQDEHPLRQCPLIIFTEATEFPSFGPFAAIADLSKRLFNLDSELDEILRAQTFSLLTLQVPDGSSEESMISVAKTVGVTISSNNLMLHTGNTPEFIAPPDGPAKIYLERIDKLRQQIDDIGLAIASPNQRESGISMQMRFHTINGALSKFAERLEDFERRAWDLCRLWLGMTQAPTVQWSRQFDLADIAGELDILSEMNAQAMPKRVIVEQQKRIVTLQFSGADDETQQEMFDAIEEQLQER